MISRVGDYVEFALDDDAYVIGIVGSVEGPDIYVVEVHAFHRYWGGSNNCRGQVTQVKQSDLAPVRQGWKHIIEKTKDKKRVRNALDELLAPARP